MVFRMSGVHWHSEKIPFLKVPNSLKSLFAGFRLFSQWNDKHDPWTKSNEWNVGKCQRNWSKVEADPDQSSDDPLTLGTFVRPPLPNRVASCAISWAMNEMKDKSVDKTDPDLSSDDSLNQGSILCDPLTPLHQGSILSDPLTRGSDLLDSAQW